MNEQVQQIEQEARALGFDWFGWAPARALESDLEQLRSWLADGRHGDMAWLGKEPERRADPRRVLDECRTVIVVGMNYLREAVPGVEAVEEQARGSAPLGRISKYARTRDYHRVMEKALRKLARLIDQEAFPGARSRGFVDYGPILERPWAALAGLGFVGKHTLLIHPRQGSFFFLGVLLTTADLGPAPSEPLREGCGDCRRCIEACPTGAITEPWKLDARRCLSYLTIEKQGPVAEEFWPHASGYVFGCDICQDVCPYNQRRAVPVEQSPLGPQLVGEAVPLVELLRAPEAFLAPLEQTSSPLKRAGAENLLRNAAMVASQRGGPPEQAALEEIAADLRRPPWLRALCRRAADLLAAKLA